MAKCPPVERERLVQENLWHDFNRYRGQLAAKMTPKKALDKAIRDFGPGKTPPKLESLAEDTVNAREGELAPWRHLLAYIEEIDEPPACGELEEIRWVKDHLIVPWKDIRPDKVPSLGAISILKIAKENDIEWFRAVARTLYASDKDDPARVDWLDDGRPHIRTIHEVREAARMAVLGQLQSKEGNGQADPVEDEDEQ